MKNDIGVIGLSVMGENLALNINDNGYAVTVYNRTYKTTKEVIARAAQHKGVVGAKTIKELVGSLKRPRKIILLVKAAAVDQVIEQLTECIDPGDLIIDGGNSHFKETIERHNRLASKGILYMGLGVSGGEKGARNGPSLMPGGSEESWSLVKEILISIAAKNEDGTPCCQRVGPDGSGHYVKMVHNGIEYGDMQIICETYHFMRDGLRFSNETMSRLFSQWNRGELNSYLIEITADILKRKEGDGSYLIDKIADRAGQKGTGKWMAAEALELGVPATMTSESVFARALSSNREMREHASQLFASANPTAPVEPDSWEKDLEEALLTAKILSYTQGFLVLKRASDEYHWNLDLGAIALLWRKGCIIKSRFLDTIGKAYEKKRSIETLLFDDYFAATVLRGSRSLRRVVAQSVSLQIPVPALSSALAFYDSLRSTTLPANLIQAQRDYFGAHTYQRIDRAPDQLFHTVWTDR